MIVADASIIVKWINVNEENNDKAALIYQEHRKEVERVIVPHLLFYEIANYLATKTRTSKRYIKEGLQLLYEASLIIYNESEEDLIETALLAKKCKTSVYDMLYAVIAKRKKLLLVTADEQFVKKTKFPFVKHIKDIKVT